MQSLFLLLVVIVSCVASMESKVSGSQHEVGVYFADWSIYARKFTPDNIPFQHINKVYYAFFKLGDDGTLSELDSWADSQIWTNWSDPDASKKVWGCLGKLRDYKKEHGFKLVGSVGGWSGSASFTKVAASASARATFAESCKKTMEKYDLDGIDLDWEYPGTAGATAAFSPEDPENLITLLQEIRGSVGDSALLSICTSINETKYSLLDYKRLNPLLNSYTMMAYDMAGSWSSTASHQAPMDDIVSNLKKLNQKYSMDLSKVVLGLPAYGRVFDGCTEIGQKYDASKIKQRPGQWEAGIWDYKAIPANAEVKYDDAAGASYAVIPGECLISYDTPAMIEKKCNDIVKTLGLKGAFFWEVSGDKSDSQSLIATAQAALQ